MIPYLCVPTVVGCMYANAFMQNASSVWKPTPFPLQIPYQDFGDVEFEQTLGDYSQMDALPRTPYSETLSPVAGATLARALFGNTYHLSSYSSRSRPSTSTRRTSAVTRTDSAILPEGETPQSGTDDWRDSFYGGSGNISGPESDAPYIPPVPPIPTHLVANGDNTHPTPQNRNMQHLPHAHKDLKGTPSLGPVLASYADNSSFIADFLNERPQGDVDVRLLRRISRLIQPPPGGFTIPPSANLPDNAPSSIQFEASGDSDDKPSSPVLDPSIVQTSRPPRPLPLTTTVSDSEDNQHGDAYAAGSSRNRAVSTPSSESWSIASRPESPQNNERPDPRKRPKTSKVALGLTLSPNSQSGE